MAQTPPNVAESLQKVEKATSEVTTSLNILWVMLTAFLVFFMQAGFALVETGFTRAKNVAHTMMMNRMVFCIGAVGYWLVGFAFQFGAGIIFVYPVEDVIRIRTGERGRQALMYPGDIDDQQQG